MTSSNNPSPSHSGAVTPDTRFTTPASSAADLLASQTVGLVHLSDFRKRRAEALERKDRQIGGIGRFTPASTSASDAEHENSSYADGVSAPHGPPAKKKRKNIAKGKLSFGIDADEQEKDQSHNASGEESPKAGDLESTSSAWNSKLPHNGSTEQRRLGANANLGVIPKAMTKSAMIREAQAREQLRKEFLSMQETVKGTEVIIPFVFYDGTNIPGGSCKIKKGDHAWLFLDRSRKVGAELGVGGGEKSKSRNEWARVGVDDLMLVRGEIIIPHHYEIYYFIVNKTLGPGSKALFDYASTTAEILAIDSNSSSPRLDKVDPISQPARSKQINNGQVTPADRNLEGVNDDPNFTKVVDRRWYERNKHIFPASVWEEFDPTKNYANGVRKDAEGNAFFFTR